ncbi:DNA/RNA helicase, superfamily II [Mycobacteroides abscessus subsp. abscessus]|nr:DNA/RNA helicase, superfamily II [Mycobacteroides abscessus subsp. abscessus]
MQLPLKDYQADATRKILTTLGYAREDWNNRQRRTAFALSSTTGSGKTVIAATVIEALFNGSDEFDVEPDSSAVVLWVSKDPALNEQTRSRFIECADRIPTGDLVLLDKNYVGSSLQTGTVYFINPDKLSKNADFVKHTDSRHRTFWEILDATIKDGDKTLYMVLDEAHEGMKEQSSGAKTIVHKIINGNGSNVAVPIVWGISATVKRFDAAMEQADAFDKVKNVVIDATEVQASGLLKDALALDIPDEKGEYSTTMVRDATLDFVGVCQRWDDYCKQQDRDPVVPLMVAQIPNRLSGEKDTEKGLKVEDELIHTVLETIRKHWPDMPHHGVAHVLGDRATIEVGSYVIPKVAPQNVEHDKGIRVLLAKDAVSTGWDCPRAEVLVSLRPGVDDTHVTQLLGRMVRTPLAASTSDERLNAASCYLPKFDKATAKRVAEEIMGMRDPVSGVRGAAVSKVMLKPVMLSRNTDVPDEVVDVIEALPSYAKPATVPKPVKRLLKAAQAFAQDRLVPEANKVAHEAMFDVLDGIVEDNADAVASGGKEILTAQIRQLTAKRGDESATDTKTSREADAATVDDALRYLRRTITTSVVNGYLHRNVLAAITAAEDAGDDLFGVDVTGIKARVAALGFLDVNVQKKVEDAADALTRLWLTTNRAKIAKLPDQRNPVYQAIQNMAREAEPVAIEVKTEELVDTVDTDSKPLPTCRLHVAAMPSGDYPIEQRMSRNTWEMGVIDQEATSGTLAGWYRNPSAAGANSLRIAHESASGSWGSVQPDFVFVHYVDDGLRPSIVDPHGSYLGDSSPKLKALAQYADEHGDLFDRIVAVGLRKGDVLLGLDLKDSKVRKAVYESAADRDSLKRLYEDHGTTYTTV